MSPPTIYCSRCDALIASTPGTYTPFVVSRASPFTREEGSGQLRIMSLCCRVSSGQAVQGVSSNSMLFAVSLDALLAGLENGQGRLRTN